MLNRAAQAALEIWQSAVQAVDSAALVRAQLHWADERTLVIAGQPYTLADDARIVVIGGGKAGAGMAAGLEEVLALQPISAAHPHRTPWTGWLNVPADCVRPLRHITLHAGRPAGLNEPTDAAVNGTQQILLLARSLRPQDVCIVLISGGASALLAAPCPGVSLADKCAVTRLLVSAGAPIEELNTVRKQLSAIKGGRLLQAFPAGRAVALIISDVCHDPLNIIGSGPTVPDDSTPEQARTILEQRIREQTQIPASVWHALLQPAPINIPAPRVAFNNVIIGNNQTALTAAAAHARRLGFRVIYQGTNQRGMATRLGAEWVEQIRQDLEHARSNSEITAPICWLSGGEPVVEFTPGARVGRGGRNQELILAAVASMQSDWPAGLAILSGGTDGEDGPTDAAGAVVDAAIANQLCASPSTLQRALVEHDAYPLLNSIGALIQTGPTHTNVMDVRVAVWWRWCHRHANKQ